MKPKKLAALKSRRESQTQECSRLTSAFSQYLAEMAASRACDSNDAQAMIKDAKMYCVYTIVGMIAVPSLSHYICIAGCLMVLTMALGTFQKYKSRLQTRLRADKLRAMQLSGKEMANFNGRIKDIKIECVSLLGIVWCNLSIVVVYLMLLAILGGALYFDVPTVVAASKGVAAMAAAVSSAAGGG